MESVIVPSNNNNNNSKIKSRLRSSTARNSKNQRQQLFNRSSSLNYKNTQNNTFTRSKSYFHPKSANNINHKHHSMNGDDDESDRKHVVSNLDNGKKNKNVDYIYGPFTREVFNAICVRLGHTVHIPEKSLKDVFNEMQLYPSESQVSAMLQSARQCSRRHGKFVLFGEFCVLVKEMQQSPKQLRNTRINSNNCKNNCEVFLGGSCNPTTWRADIAIPHLKNAGISFYNPQVSMWAPELVAEEHKAKQSASILFFVVDSQTRSTSGMIEVAYLVASGRCVILVANDYRPQQAIMGEVISNREFIDLVDGQSNLLMLVKSRGVTVHKNVYEALQRTKNILDKSSTHGFTPEQQITNKLSELRKVFDSYNGRGGQIKLSDVLKAFEDVTHRPLNISKLYDYLSKKTNTDNFTTNVYITFDQFCALVAEFSTDDGCDTYCDNHRNGWAAKPFNRQNTTNRNSNNNDVIPSCWNLDNDNDILKPTNHRTFDVYLGGSLTTRSYWRTGVAIPLLKKHGLSYYNPAHRENGTNSSNIEHYSGVTEHHNGDVEHHNGGTEHHNGDTEHHNGDTEHHNGDIEHHNVDIDNNVRPNEKVLEWKQAMDTSRVLLFVITNDTRSLTSMILASYYIGLGRKVVLAIQELPTDVCVVSNETLSSQAIKDYNRGRVYLTDLAKRKQVPVFENITEAVQSTINTCQADVE